MTCGGTLAFALAMAAIGLFDGLTIQTEGWETRGTMIADRQAPYALYSGDGDGDSSSATAYLETPRARRRLSSNPSCASQTDTYQQSQEDMNVIFQAKSGVDLWSSDAFAAMCEFTESYMSVSGYGDMCRHESVCDGLPAGESFGTGWEWWESRGDSSYQRCVRGYGYPTYLYKTAGYSGCSEYRTNSALQAKLATEKTCMKECAAAKASDSSASCTSLSGCSGALLTYDASALDAKFGLSGVTDLTLTRSVATMDSSRKSSRDRIYEWSFDIFDSGTLSKLAAPYAAYFDVYVDTRSSDVREFMVDKQLTTDMMLAMGAVVIIVVLLWVHMGSVWLTLGGIIQVLLSFPSAIFFTKRICGINFFPFLNFIGVFVIAGIGADDCFVIYDKWQQAKCRLAPGQSALDVAKHSYWDSAWAMFLTSLTTAAAFFSNAVIPIAPIRVFAVFMGAMVVFDYLYDITIFAAMIAWQHDRIIRYEQTGRNTVGSWFLDFWGSVARCRCCGGRSRKPDVIIDNTRERRSTSEAFIADKIYPVIHFLRWVLTLCLCGAFAAGIYSASKLTTPRDSEVQMLPEDNMFTKFSFLQRSGFKSSNEASVWPKVVWGIHPGDNGNHFNPKSKPTFHWDTTFDMSSPESQTWLKNFCEDTKTNMASNSRANCWLTYMDTWLSSNPTPVSECGGATSIPVPEANFYDCAYAYANSGSYYQFLNRPFTSAFYVDSNGKRRMKIMAIEFAASVLWTASIEELEKEWERWENYVTAKIATAPEGLRNAYQTCEAWAWMDTVKQMRDGVYIAGATTLAIAAFTTMLSTQNVIVCIYSLLCILTILGCTVGTIVSLGWTLGFLEGICITILIGLSVDYVVHIGHAYAHAARHEGATRRECARHAVSMMGFPVLSAAFTTFCAALALLRAVVVFFTKFGTIVLLSTVYSSIVSVVLFIALLAAAGPVNGFGDVTRLCGRKKLAKTQSIAY